MFPASFTAEIPAEYFAGNGLTIRKTPQALTK